VANTSQTNGTIRSWFSTLKYSWRTALQIDRSQLTAVRAIRSTIGVAVPLILGVATGHVIEGVSIAGGALSLGSIGLSDPHHVRARTMLLACVGIAISAFVGSVTSHIGWLAVLVVGLWGFGAGLLVSLGQSAMIIGLQSTIALIILSHFALDPVHAALQAALMLAGALFQTIVALIPVPGQRIAPELAALSSVYQALAAYAANPANEQYGQQVRNALSKAHAAIPGNDHQSQQEAILSELLEEAERLRLTLIIFRRWRQYLKDDPMAQASNVEYIDQFLQAVADQLRAIANELQPTPWFISRVKPHQQIKQSLTALRQQGSTPAGEQTLRPMMVYADALRDQLHTAKKLAKSWKHQPHHQLIHLHIPKPTHLQLHNVQATIRANLTFRSATFRHAIRLGVTLALATALYKITPLPINNGYWIPLTALVVLRPDFSTTVIRGIARTLGTLLGAVLATILVSLLAPTKDLLALLVVIVTYLSFSIFLVNYAFFSLFITMEIVFLLTFITPQPLITAESRAINTAVGGILALLMYILWPTWEHSQVRQLLADRLEALHRYCIAVLEIYANPTTYDPRALDRLRMESRLSRSNAKASVERLQHEPGPHRIDTDLAQGLLEATDTIAQSVLTLEAYLQANPTHYALPEMATITKKIDEAFQALITAIREGQSVSAFPNLQEALQELRHIRKQETHISNDARTNLRLVLIEVKHIICTLNTMHQLIECSNLGMRNLLFA
jgi:uncharacterized membrane protein YccC